MSQGHTPRSTGGRRERAVRDRRYGRMAGRPPGRQVSGQCMQMCVDVTTSPSHAGQKTRGLQKQLPQKRLVAGPGPRRHQLWWGQAEPWTRMDPAPCCLLHWEESCFCQPAMAHTYQPSLPSLKTMNRHAGFACWALGGVGGNGHAPSHSMPVSPVHGGKVAIL